MVNDPPAGDKPALPGRPRAILVIVAVISVLLWHPELTPKQLRDLAGVLASVITLVLTRVGHEARGRTTA